MDDDIHRDIAFAVSKRTRSTRPGGDAVNMLRHPRLCGWTVDKNDREKPFDSRFWNYGEIRLSFSNGRVGSR